MDVISLHQAGFENTVAPLGTAFTTEQANLLSRYTKEIVLMLDADAAGQKAVRRASELLENTGLSVRVVVVPDGKDPDEYIKKNPAYGRIICRCETISEGEIIDALRRNPKATDIDGVKRRTRAGMGRCQGGFCMPYVMRLIEKETGKPMTEITKKGGKSNTVTGRL